MYSGIVAVIDPRDMHEIPGVTAYNDVWDPVVNGSLQGALSTSNDPVTISPYTVRYLKERLVTFGGFLRPLRNW